MSRSLRCILLLTVVSLCTTSRILAQVTTKSVHRVSLKSRTISPEVHSSSVNWIESLPEPRHVYLQTIHPADRRGLEAEGIRFLKYVPEHTWIATIPQGWQPSDEARRTLTWAGSILPQDKVPSDLLKGKVGDWAKEDGERARLWVRVYDDVWPERIGEIVVQHGAEVTRSWDQLGRFEIVVPEQNLLALIAEDEIQSAVEAPPPMVEHNDGARASVFADEVQAAPVGYSGAGVDVGIWDSGSISEDHPDFAGRAILEERVQVSRHATLVAGIVGGSGRQSVEYGGSDGQWRGMAPGSIIHSYYWDNPVQDHQSAINDRGIDLSQNSWGFVVGYEPISGVCYNNRWAFGSYIWLASDYDQLVRGKYGRPISVVFAAGNDRDDICPSTGIPDPLNPLGYRSIAPPATAKNTIVVGAISSDDDQVTSYSSWGPTDDGRIKPDLVGPGDEVGGDSGIKSTSLGGAYALGSGTSMAAPVVSGCAALVTEAFRAALQAEPLPSTIKAILINSARDLPPRGPDFRTGFGAINVANAVERIRGGQIIAEESADDAGIWSRQFAVAPGNDSLRVTLCWDDPAAVENVLRTLVNDLDLVLRDPLGVEHFPFVLDPNQPDVPATTGIDTVNNVEHIVVQSPRPGIWTAYVRGTSVPVAPQSFSLVANASEATADVFGPSVVQAWVTPNPTDGAEAVELRAVLSDRGFGDSHVSSAYFTVSGNAPDPRGGNLISDDGAFDEVEEHVSGVVDVSHLPPGLHSLYVYCADAKDNTSEAYEVPILVTSPGTSAKVRRINAGGAVFLDSQGDIWSEDRPFVAGEWGYIGGSISSTQQNITGTPDQQIYQTAREGIESYRFTTPNGKCLVQLRIAEPLPLDPGARIFGVSSEGRTVFDALDIVAVVGNGVAYRKSFISQVKDGVLDLDFNAIRDKTLISGISVACVDMERPVLGLGSPSIVFSSEQAMTSLPIENKGGGTLTWRLEKTEECDWLSGIWPSQGIGDADAILHVTRTGLSTGTYTTQLRVVSNGGTETVDVTLVNLGTPPRFQQYVNCGGGKVFASGARIWVSDQPYSRGGWGYVGGHASKTSKPIADTSDDPVYQTQRVAPEAYRFDVTPGRYRVQMHFADIAAGRLGQSRFDVDLEGERVLTGFDIESEAGEERALSKEWVVQVTDGRLDIEFSAQSGQPSIAGIHISRETETGSLSFSRLALDFGSTHQELSFSISSPQGGAPEWEVTKQEDASWITDIEPAHGRGEGTVTVRVSRQGLRHGTFSGTLAVTSNSNTQVIRCTITSARAPKLAVEPVELVFGSGLEKLPLNINNLGGGALDWRVHVPENISWIRRIVPSSGNGNGRAWVYVSPGGLEPGEYHANLHVTSNGGSFHLPVTLRMPELKIVELLVNSGGDAFKDSKGRLWQADRPYSPGEWGYVGGKTFSTMDPISGTLDDGVYQSERFRVGEYRFDVANGVYTVELHFAEIWANSPGKRRFNVYGEDEMLLKSLDIYGEAGHDYVYVHCSKVVVGDGQLNIRFEGLANSTKVSGIAIRGEQWLEAPMMAASPQQIDFGFFLDEQVFEIRNAGRSGLSWCIEPPADAPWLRVKGEGCGSDGGFLEFAVDRSGLSDGEYTTRVRIESNGGDMVLPVHMGVGDGPQLAFRVNAGGDEFVDRQGRVWAQDQPFRRGKWGYVGGMPYSVDAAIGGTVAGPLYATERTDMSGYVFDLPPDLYRVTLHLAEIWAREPGVRVFDVSLEDSLWLDDLDIYGLVGQNAPLERSAWVPVTDGELLIAFGTELNRAKVSAIEVVSKAAAENAEEEFVQLTSPPKEFQLAQNFPNPVFAGIGEGTRIVFWAPHTEFVSIRVYNVLGQEVAKIVNETLEAGVHTIRWSGNDASGYPLPAGLFFCVMEAGDFRASRKMLIVR